MTLENIKALSDSELSQVVAWGQQEQTARAERRKQETIAKIKELAGAVGVSVTIGQDRRRANRNNRSTKIRATSPKD